MLSNDSPCFSAAHCYIARRLAVVPIRRALVPSDNGRASRVPWIKRQAEGIPRPNEVESVYRNK